MIILRHSGRYSALILSRVIAYHNVPSTSNTMPFKTLLPSRLTSGLSGAKLRCRDGDPTIDAIVRAEWIKFWLGCWNIMLYRQQMPRNVWSGDGKSVGFKDTSQQRGWQKIYLKRSLPGPVRSAPRSPLIEPWIRSVPSRCGQVSHQSRGRNSHCKTEKPGRMKAKSGKKERKKQKK